MIVILHIIILIIENMSYNYYIMNNMVMDGFILFILQSRCDKRHYYAC